MAGLGVLLETTAAAPATTPAHTIIVSKATLLHTTANKVIRDVDDDGSGSRRLPMSVPAATASCSFLQRCFLCRRELADGRDIYIYRGDRAFCSDECRCRHILADQDDDCARALAADRSRRRRSHHAIAGGFAF
ncbi:hypothetical protein U9M48_001331 [Paspalum notatum var. saurae]|uniref:FLZ-type domain-containing protein n=1 Tax=Paspalum notatum var. saurae TaxID=547442 RepID=A0AAQ3PNH8_PASNO